MEPGPGEYKKIEVVGNINPKRLTSVIPTSQANAFSKAKDRFSVPTLKDKLPGPGQHSPKTNFLEH